MVGPIGILQVTAFPFLADLVFFMRCPPQGALARDRSGAEPAYFACDSANTHLGYNALVLAHEISAARRDGKSNERTAKNRSGVERRMA
jgi:hypothetical protein